MKADAKLEDRMRTEMMLRDVLNAPTMTTASKEALVKDILQQKLKAAKPSCIVPDQSMNEKILK